jgi:large conductance mechanosensitive channel
MLKEFRDFALRGSVIDLAVGVIIGAAFGSIVTSFVNDILMPPITALLGGANYADAFLLLKGDGPFATLADAKAAGAITWNYGLFITNVINFLIIAFSIFMVVRAFNRMKRAPAPAPEAPTTKECPYCFTSIPIKARRCPNCTSELK